MRPGGQNRSTFFFSLFLLLLLRMAISVGCALQSVGLTVVGARREGYGGAKSGSVSHSKVGEKADPSSKAQKTLGTRENNIASQ
jgi:hypothetical protein